jgi:hypothetical protein
MSNENEPLCCRIGIEIDLMRKEALQRREALYATTHSYFQKDSLSIADAIASGIMDSDSPVMRGFSKVIAPSDSLENMVQEVRSWFFREGQGNRPEPSSKIVVLSYRHTDPSVRARRDCSVLPRLDITNIRRLGAALHEVTVAARQCIQVWVDQIYSVERNKEDPASESETWSNEALVPYAIWPVLYFSNSEGEDAVNCDRTWLALERELGISCSGYTILECGPVPSWFAVGYTGLQSYGNGRYLPLDRGMQEATSNFLQYAEATETFWMSDKEEIINFAGRVSMVGLHRRAVHYDRPELPLVIGLELCERVSKVQQPAKSVLAPVGESGRVIALRENYHIRYGCVPGPSPWLGILEWCHHSLWSIQRRYPTSRRCVARTQEHTRRRTLIIKVFSGGSDGLTHDFFVLFWLNADLEPFRVMIVKVSDSDHCHGEEKSLVLKTYIFGDTDLAKCVWDCAQVASVVAHLPERERLRTASLKETDPGQRYRKLNQYVGSYWSTDFGGANGLEFEIKKGMGMVLGEGIADIFNREFGGPLLSLGFPKEKSVLDWEESQRE